MGPWIGGARRTPQTSSSSRTGLSLHVADGRAWPKGLLAFARVAEGLTPFAPAPARPRRRSAWHRDQVPGPLERGPHFFGPADPGSSSRTQLERTRSRRSANCWRGYGRRRPELTRPPCECGMCKGWPYVFHTQPAFLAASSASVPRASTQLPDSRRAERSIESRCAGAELDLPCSATSYLGQGLRRGGSVLSAITARAVVSVRWVLVLSATTSST